MNESLHISCPHCLATNRIPRSRLENSPQCGRCKESLFSARPVEADAESFDRILANTDIPVLVDFWAEWCGPCKMMSPIFNQAAAALEPDCRLVKVNTEQVQQIAARYQIRSIPTLMLMHQGREVARQAGAMDLNSLQRWVKGHL